MTDGVGASPFCENRGDISPKWPGLTLQLLNDIYTVHKAFNYGQFQRTEYKLSEFKNDVKKAENTIFGETSFAEMVSRNESLFHLTLYPLYLVNDDVFGVMACHFAVSALVNGMIKDFEELTMAIEPPSDSEPDSEPGSRPTRCCTCRPQPAFWSLESASVTRVTSLWFNPTLNQQRSHVLHYSEQTQR